MMNFIINKINFIFIWLKLIIWKIFFKFIINIEKKMINQKIDKNFEDDCNYKWIWNDRMHVKFWKW